MQNQNQSLKQHHHQALMQQALLQQQSLYHSGLLPPSQVEGDGRLAPATDDEVMEVEDFINDKSSVHYVLDPDQTPSNDDTFVQEFCEGLLKFEDSSTQGDEVVDTTATVDLGKLNSQFEEVTRSKSKSTPLDGEVGDAKGSDPLVESEPSTSTMCASWKPDFSKLKGEICLENLSVRELHATFKATFGRETSVKDKQWLKRRISMGLSNSCDVSTTTFIIENNKVIKKAKVEECNNKDENDKDGRRNVSGDSIKMEEHLSGSVQSATSKHQIAIEDDYQGGSANKRVRKPTKRYIEEVSESEPVSSGNGPRTRVRPVHKIQPVRRPLVTRQDSLGGSGVEIPYVSRIRRGRPRENIMALMTKFQSCGMGMTASIVKKAQPDNEIENQELKPVTGENEGDMKKNDWDEGYADAEEDSSDDNILTVTVATAKGGIRRKHHRPWSLSEVVKLVEGVSRYGAGRWSEIKRISFATCSHRTAVDLKDKWRNLLRASFAQLPAEKGVQNSKKHSSIPIPASILLRVRELAEMQPQVTPEVKFGGRNVNDIRSGFL